jgi:hypothetical protein
MGVCHVKIEQGHCGDSEFGDGFGLAMDLHKAKT